MIASRHELGDQPIEERVRDEMRAIATVLDATFNHGKTGEDRTVGFIVMVFPFDQADGKHRCNYVSNASREDVIVLLKEQLARFQGQPEMKGTA